MKVFREIALCRSYLSNINMKIDTLIKKLCVIHNKENRPLAWLETQERAESLTLRGRNPEIFDYVMDIMKLYLGGNEKPYNGDSQGE